MSRLPELECEISGSLNHPESWTVRFHDCLTSTMDEARNLVPELGAGYGLVAAETQSAGRGRAGRQWVSSVGGCYVSYIFRSKIGPSALSGWSLAVGCALRRFLEALDCPVLLKWPNDVLTFDQKKLAGVLVETISKEGEYYVLTGIGLNLISVSKELPNATSIFEESGREYTQAECLIALTPILLNVWKQFEANGLPEFKQEFLKHAVYLGEPVKIQNSGALLTGRYLGIADNGALLLNIGESTQEIAVGDLHALQAEPT